MSGRRLLGSVLSPLRTPYRLHRWRMRRKAGRSLRATIGDAPSFFRDLDAAGVRYVVLRWFDPASAEETIQLLVGDQPAGALARAVGRQVGRLPIEIRSVTGNLGLYGGMPYYPPAFADELLDTRVRGAAGHYEVAPERRLDALLFHVAYHKAEDSGLPIGGTDPSTSVVRESSRDYVTALREVASEVGKALPEPLTLHSIHDHLVERDFAIEFDLLVRWPRETGFIRAIKRADARRFTALADRLRDIAAEPVVVIFRTDLPDAMRERTIAVLAKQFSIRDHGALDAAQQARCLRHLRGGNWRDRRGSVLSGPNYYVLCADEKTGRTDDERLWLKKSLRSKARALVRESGTESRATLHASDDRAEAAYMLTVLFGSDADGLARRLRGDRSTRAELEIE